jgi:hypothetical protein
MTSEITPTTILSQRADLLVQPMDDELVMASLEAGEYYGLAATGKRIWELLAAPITFGDLCATLVREYEVDAETCAHDVLAFVGELASEGLVEAAAA